MPIPAAHDLPDLARDLHGALPRLSRYMTDVAVPRVQSAKSAECDDTILGLLIRATSHVGSLVRLDHASDYQAVGACTRALFETMLDIALVTKSPASHEKVVAWEELQALKYAQQIVKSGGDSHSVAVQLAQRFITAREKEITAKCARLGLKKHERWTGRSVANDAGVVDGDCPDAQLAAGSLASWQWTLLNWATHGSTLVGIRTLGTTGQAALLATVRFTALHCGLACANLALKHAGHLDDPDVTNAAGEIAREAYELLAKYFGQADVLAALLEQPE